MFFSVSFCLKILCYVFKINFTLLFVFLYVIYEIRFPKVLFYAILIFQILFKLILSIPYFNLSLHYTICEDIIKFCSTISSHVIIPYICDKIIKDAHYHIVVYSLLSLYTFLHRFLNKYFHII